MSQHAFPRRALPAALLLGVALSGCLVVQQAEQVPPAAARGWTPDCKLGSFERTLNATWGQVCEARASHTVGPKEETWVAINPTDPDNVIVAAKDLNPESSKGCVWNGVFVTHDGGRTWKDVVIGGRYADRTPGSTFYGYACNTDPMFRFTKDGSVHYGVEMYNLGGQNADGIAPKSPVTDALAAASVIPGWKILLATSRDGGDTWPNVVTFQQDEGVVTDYSRMTVNPGTQSILEMIGAEAGGCHILASRDGGKGADLTPTIPLGPDGSSPCEAIAGSPHGTVVLLGGGKMLRSKDDGKTWGDESDEFAFKQINAFSESKYRVGSGMELVYDLTDGARAGTLYATYAAADRDEADVYVRSSTDDGKTWSEPAMVNNDSAGPHQWMPNIAVAGDGSVHVFYMDKRYDPAHKLIDLTHAVSLDGGKTWTNERVSTLSFDGDLGVHQEGFPFIGDYLGVDAVGTEVWAGFPDASNGHTTVIAAAHVHLVPEPHKR